MGDERFIYKAKRKNWKVLPEGMQWVEGDYAFFAKHDNHCIYETVKGFTLVCDIDPSTACKGIVFPNKTIWENDIYRWKNPTYGTCTGIIRFGRYEQDGSGGEYPGIPCYGFYAEVVKIEPYPESGLDESDYPDHMRQISVLEMLERNSDVVLIGNAFDATECTTVYPGEIAIADTAEQEQKAIEQLERISSMLGCIGETEDHTETAIRALEENLIYHTLGLPEEIRRKLAELGDSGKQITAEEKKNLEESIEILHILTGTGNLTEEEKGAIETVSDVLEIYLSIGKTEDYQEKDSE